MPGRPALALLILVCLPPHNTVLSLPVGEEEADRGRGVYPYLPRNVGKDSFYREYRGLIPFPRVGRAANTWDLPPHLLGEVLPETDVKMKKAANIRSRSADTAAFNRRLLRSMPADAFSRRLLRSTPDAFSRRLLKRSGKHDPFARRLLRAASPSSAFNRRLLRSDPASTRFSHHMQLRSGGEDAFKRRILKKSAQEPMIAAATGGGAVVAKRQSLIPFPRTGKRSDPEVALPVLQEMDSAALQPPVDEQALFEPLTYEELMLEDEDYDDELEEDEREADDDQ